MGEFGEWLRDVVKYDVESERPEGVTPEAWFACVARVREVFLQHVQDAGGFAGE